MKEQARIQEDLKQGVANLEAKIALMETQITSLEHKVEAREKEIHNMKTTVAEA